MLILRALIGLVFFCGVAWLLSSHRRKFPWRVVFFGLGLQVVLAWLTLGTELGRAFFQGIAAFMNELVGMAEPGANLVFGPLANFDKMAAVFGPDSAFIFAFAAKGLMALLFFAALMGILYHLGIMQAVIWVLAKLMAMTMGVSGAESMAMAANVFVGQTEAPLVVRPYIKDMTLSELNSLMVGGFATIAGTVLAVYFGFVGEALGPHLLTASVMSAPAAFVLAKIMVPETEVAATGGRIEFRIDRTATNVIEAAANGTSDGIKLALNVAGMLIAFMALVALIDWPLVALGDWIGMEGGLSLSRLMGWIFAPVAWAMGIESWHDSQIIGVLLGQKLAVTEFVAFTNLQELILGDSPLGKLESVRSSTMATYALCGFANFASIGIQIGGISALAPERKADLSRLAVRAMLGGAFASWMTATVAGAFL